MNSAITVPKPGGMPIKSKTSFYLRFMNTSRRIDALKPARNADWGIALHDSIQTRGTTNSILLQDRQGEFRRSLQIH